MPSISRWALPAAAAAATLGLLWLRERATPQIPAQVPAGRALEAPAAAPVPPASPSALGSAPAAAEMRRALAEADPLGGPAPPLDDRELVAALERLAALGGPEGISIAELEEALAPLVFSGENLERVIALLREGRLGGGEELSTAERGAIAALYWATVLHVQAGDDPRFAAAGVDGDRLLRDVLALVADVTPAAREGLLGWLGTAVVDERPLLSLAYLEDLLALRARYPDLREEYSELITRLGGELDPTSRRAFYSLFLSETEDPTVVKFALSRLLEEGGDVERLLAWTQQRIDLDGDPELREELIQAVAASAPPEVAARFLERNLGPEQYQASFALGMRDGGIDALAKSYDELLASGASPDRRRILIAGMVDADPATLLGISEIDPDPGVRGQALITASAGGGANPTSAEAVRRAWEARAEAGAITPYPVVLAASNLAHSGTDADVRTTGVAILEEAVRDGSLPGYVREQALGFLEGLLPQEEYELLALELGGH